MQARSRVQPVLSPLRGLCGRGQTHGFRNPEREQLKARLTLQIYRLIKDRGLTQAEAGKILGIQQPHVSSLMRGQSGAFSVERLMDFLTALGQDVEITLRPTRKERGKMSVGIVGQALSPASVRQVPARRNACHP
jgi:predicted XRE-type DNA-binding protein